MLDPLLMKRRIVLGRGEVLLDRPAGPFERMDRGAVG